MSKQAGIVREDEGHRRASRTRDHGVWTESFRVHSYEVDARGTTPIHTICNYLQETAGNHARALGVSAESMHARGLAWVLRESPDAADHHQVVTVRDSDLGLNRHVNAARYAAWAVEALPPSIRTDRRLARLELRFCAESTRGDTIATDAQWEDGTRAHAASSLDVLHRLSRVEEDQTLAMARSR